MMQTATGSGTLELRDLAINGLNSKALPSILQGADSISGDVSDTSIAPFVESSLFAGSLNFDKLDIPFAITGAKLRADKVSSSNADLRLDAEGTLSLEDARLEAGLEATFNPGEQAVTGAEPTVRLNWSGAFNAPDLDIDLTQMTSFLSLRRFEQERRRVEILQAKMAEQQRLRREAALYRARATERERLKQKALDEARLLEKAQQALKAQAREEEDRRKKTLEQQGEAITPESPQVQ
jgi:hypothetical protein